MKIRNFVCFLGVLASTSVLAADAYTILKVDKDEISSAQVEQIWNGLFPDGTAPDFDQFDEKVRQNVLRGVVSEHLIYREAMSSGIQNSKKVKQRIEDLQKKIITQAFLEEKALLKIDDKKLKKIYDKEFGSQEGEREVRARHILVATEEEAEKIIEELENGAEFEALAKVKSLDKGTAKNGGDLGFFGKGRMVDEFSEVAFSIDEDEVSDPVKTEFGWHILRVEDERESEPPSFDEVKDFLREQAKGEAIKDYVNDLVDSANVTYFDKSGKEKELTRTPDRSGE